MADRTAANSLGLNKRYVDLASGLYYAECVVVARPVYTLLSNAAATGAGVTDIVGGNYVWRAESSNWNGATAKLQVLGLDGVTWVDVLDTAAATVTLTANGYKVVTIGQGATVRVLITSGPPTAVYSNLGGF